MKIKATAPRGMDVRGSHVQTIALTAENVSDQRVLGEVYPRIREGGVASLLALTPLPEPDYEAGGAPQSPLSDAPVEEPRGALADEGGRAKHGGPGEDERGRTWMGLPRGNGQP